MTELAEKITQVVLGVLKRGGDNYNIYVAVEAALTAVPAGLEKHVTIDPEGLTRAAPAISGEREDLLELANQIERARTLYLNQFGTSNADSFRMELTQLLWDNKGTFASALRAAAQPASPLRGPPNKLTGEIACILEDCGSPDMQSPEALAELIRHYQPTWDRVVAALSAFRRARQRRR